MKKVGLLVSFIFLSLICFGQDSAFIKNLVKYQCKIWRRAKLQGYAKVFADVYKKKQSYNEFISVNDSVFSEYTNCYPSNKIDSCKKTFSYTFKKINNQFFLQYQKNNELKTEMVFSLNKNDTTYPQGNFKYFNNLAGFGEKWFFYKTQTIKTANGTANCYVFQCIQKVNFGKQISTTAYYIQQQSLIPIQIKQYYSKTKGLRINKIVYSKKII